MVGNATACSCQVDETRGHDDEAEVDVLGADFFLCGGGVVFFVVVWFWFQYIFSILIVQLTTSKFRL